MSKAWCYRIVFCVIALPVNGAEPEITAEQLEFFESRIRPVLVEKCESCHNSVDTAEGGLVLDYRQALRKGGQSGATINIKVPGKSLLLKVLRHEIEDLEMPQNEDRLSEKTIADFEQWIAIGAPDPRSHPPKEAEGAQVETWENTLAERKKWWSFQPITKPDAPQVNDKEWSSHPVDLFILSKLEESKLEPARVADSRTLIRRLSFVLRGLPPTPKEIEEYLADKSPDAFEELVDRFLASNAFGEHWARHWMDLVRYSETHGSEHDPAVPHAWKYRDYLIRAFNNDLPYDQLVREHIAGDLLPEPRINSKLGINESAIGPAHWRMCFHGFAPTDALDEKVRFTDDQINVFSKAFLGLTVSCARCHNHKFDAISQTDYYALFGILGSTRPGIIDINPPDVQFQSQVELGQLKTKMRQSLASSWLASLDGLESRIEKQVATVPVEELKKTDHLLHPLFLARENPERLGELAKQGNTQTKVPKGSRYWDLTNPADAEQWFSHGNGTAGEPTLPGDFTIPHLGNAIGPLLSGGVYSHLLSTKHRNVYSSPHFLLEGKNELWIRVVGNREAMVRYVVQNYPRSGTVYPVTTLNDGKWRWQKYDLAYWQGDEIHIELTTAADSAILAKNVERSWFGIQEVVVAPKGTFHPPVDAPAYEEIFNQKKDDVSQTVEQLASRYADALKASIQAWQAQLATDSQVKLIEEARQLGLLEMDEASKTKLGELVQKYLELEIQLKSPNRVPGLLEADAVDQALFIRGNHRQPGADIPRGFLEAIDDSPYEATNSGRLQLADNVVRDDNPLTRRVVVNRIWHYLFGAGLVRSVDNFGKLGEKPSHPELLDDLAVQMQVQGWSMKNMIRYILLSKTWQLESRSSELAQENDPDNRLLSHASIRRLEGEVLRDSLLANSGRLERTMYGPPVGNVTSHERRSLYLSVRRNSLNPFLKTFDFPVPAATKGRRDSTNVPAQSLTLLNDAFVISSARLLATRTGSEKNEASRIQMMFERSLGRRPTEQELQAAKAYLIELRKQYVINRQTQQQIKRGTATQNKFIDSILSPVRKRLIAMKQSPQSTRTSIAAPIAEWRFEGNFKDEIGNLHGEAKGNARVENGALILDGKSHFASVPLEVELHAKTLEALVQLDNLDQRGGGIMTVQDLAGVVFDAIVFGEKQPRHWLAGSNNFARTQDFGGTTEEEAVKQPVHIAITYASDGTIRGFRNGSPYGEPYRKANPAHFKAGAAQILFGLRHGNPSGNRMLTGKILEARLYDRALQPDEVEAIASDATSFVSERDVIAALTPAQAKQLEEARARIAELEREQMKFGSPPVAEHQEWTDLAHAIFNLKEYLYMR